MHIAAPFRSGPNRTIVEHIYSSRQILFLLPLSLSRSSQSIKDSNPTTHPDHLTSPPNKMRVALRTKVGFSSMLLAQLEEYVREIRLRLEIVEGRTQQRMRVRDAVSTVVLAVQHVWYERDRPGLAKHTRHDPDVLSSVALGKRMLPSSNRERR